MESSKKKKKGRPSLLDLQKRNLKEQQDQLHINHKNSYPNYKSAPNPNPPLRRSTRRNPNSDEDDQEEEKTRQLDRQKRRDKKLKLATNLPSSSQRSDGSDSNTQFGENQIRRKINAIVGGSELAGADKLDNAVSCSKSTSNQQGVKVDSGPSTPLPDKKLLLFILERLQKKDTYSVFSEPVDPEELPDYHDIIEHPMDFSTVKKKLASGAYACLEHFEKDIFLICSNAMQYNSPDTVYFRQARSIQELAKRNFENLRQNSDDDGDDKPEPKVVRRGRPPTKHLKKPISRPSLERAGSEFSDATLANGSCNGDPNWLTENKFDWNDEFKGSVLKGNSKLGNKQYVLDDNRRHTYNQFHPSAGEPSVLATFSVERKQLMAVGLHSEQGYARSLARFAANLGPVAWKIASKRIERSLTVGMKFGPGWVGEDDVLPHRPLTLPAPPGQPPSSQPLSVDSKEDQSSERHEEDNPNAIKPSPPIRQGTNGTNGPNGFNLPAQMDKLLRSGGSTLSSQTHDGKSRINNKKDTHDSEIRTSSGPDLNKVSFDSTHHPDLALQL